ncbi:hypothetical protein GUJ93_ZPchr0004g39559 [Zizania palustris]|uniref:Uncharacterized protein n=1 Tax=Zizania palustris TaxID=103762 RepID=A0A8J5SQV0_ZIZPA|nr:hypothetical protein GUJ93_ZPchr0004g39559 [Zizania palustris]
MAASTDSSLGRPPPSPLQIESLYAVFDNMTNEVIETSPAIAAGSSVAEAAMVEHIYIGDGYTYYPYINGTLDAMDLVGNSEIDDSNIIEPTIEDLSEKDRVELEARTRELHTLFLGRFTKAREGFDSSVPDLSGAKVTPSSPRMST